MVTSIQILIQLYYQLSSFNYLTTNMYDLANHTNNLQHTWQSTWYQTRIDYIWASDTLIPYLHKFEIDNSSSFTNSDHQILISTWSFPFALSRTNQKSKYKRRVFNYKSTSKEDLESFTNQINSNMDIHQVSTNIDTT